MEWLFWTVVSAIVGWAAVHLLMWTFAPAWKRWRKAVKPKRSKKLAQIEKQITAVSERILRLQDQLANLKRQWKTEHKNLNP